MKKFTEIFKNKKGITAAICIAILLTVGGVITSNLNTEPPQLYLSSEFSKTIQTIRGGYSWSNWSKNIIADSIHPTEFQYTADNTLVIEKNTQIILSNKKIKINRRHPFELSSLECFDKNNVAIENYKISPTYINGDLYINAPSANGIYICSVIIKYKQGTAGYSYKLAIDDEANINK